MRPKNATRTHSLISLRRFSKLASRLASLSFGGWGKKGVFSVIVAGLFILNGCGGSEYDYQGPGLATVKEDPDTAPWFTVYRPADLASAVEQKGHLLPVIVWANGGCFRSDFTWQPLFKRWAAEGYVVLALSASPGAGQLGMTSVTQHGALIDWALNQADYVDMLDADKVVAAGNSCGGVTALGLTAIDPRVSAVFVLSGSSALGASSNNIMDDVTVPVGFVVGGPSDIAGPNAVADYNALAEGIPGMVANRFEGGHQTVSTTVPILEEIADISFNWMQLALYGSTESYNELTSAKVCSDCTPEHWTLTSKHLDTLLQ